MPRPTALLLAAAFGLFPGRLPAQTACDADPLSASRMTDGRPLRVGVVKIDHARVETFSPVEISADVSATYDNPFDPDQVRVDAEVTRPDGRTVTVPGFYAVPVKIDTVGRSERAEPAGAPGFRVRYSPVVAGKHRVVVTATNRGATARSSATEFTATAGTSPGFVRVAPKAPRYFAFDGGRPYVAVGENVCWANGGNPLRRYGEWLRALGAAGGNWGRLWLAFNEKGLEWSAPPTPKGGTGRYLGLGRYAQDNAARLDEVVRIAGESGVYLMVCIGTYGEFTDGGYFNEGAWVSNPYNVRNGGPCAKPADFWTNPEARRLYQRRLRYLVARWGYSPHVFAWEFWNEVPASPEVNAWTAEMAAYLKRTDPNRHMVSTSYGDAKTWACPDVDFTMTHMYGQAGHTADFTRQIASEARALRKVEKPYLLAEFGIDWQTGDERWDKPRSGLNMHNGAWASLLGGAAGTSMLWYWDGYVHPSNLYHVLTPVRRFADAVDWTGSRLEPVDGVKVEVSASEPETFTDLTVSAGREWGRGGSDEYTLGRDGEVKGGPVAMTIGSPNRGNRGELASKLTWHVDMPRAGRVVVRLGQVCSGARLKVDVDGRVCVDRPLKAGPPGDGPWKSARRLEQWKVWVSDYDEDVAFDVPAGRHTIGLANAEGDWLQIRSVRFPSYRSSRYPSVDALALGSDAVRLVWVHNQASTWRAEYDGKALTFLRSLAVRVPAADGVWTVEWWDTYKGVVSRREQVRAAGGAMVLTIPELTSDVAVRATRVRSGP